MLDLIAASSENRFEFLRRYYTELVQYSKG